MADAIDRQRDHFNAITDRYVSGRRDKNHIAVKRLIWREALKGVNFELPDRFSVLEPMCGTGEGRDLVSSLISGRFEYSGFDNSDEIVAKAKADDPGANIWKADVTTVDLPKSAYDVAVILGGLHHVPFHVRQTLSTISGALKPGGYFINFEPTSGNPAFGWMRERIYKKNDIFDEETERGFDVKDLLGLVEGANMRPERIIFPGLAAYVMYYNPYAFPALNIGSPKTVERIFAIDRLFMSNPVGRFFSFATFSVWRRNA